MKWASGWVTGIAGSVIAALVLGWLAGGLGPWSAGIALLVGGGLAGWTVWQVDHEPSPPWSAWSWIPLLAFVLFAFHGFGWVAFVTADSLRVGSPYNLGDYPLHLALVQYFASGVPLWPEHPFWHEGTLAYPAGINIFHALWALLGWQPILTLTLAGWMGAVAVYLALRQWGGDFVVAAFLFNCGLMGWTFQSGVVGVPQDIDWKSIPLTMLATQRGLLYAIPAGLLLLIQWRVRLEGARKPPLPVFVEWLVYSTLPLFHVHTFLICSWVLAGAYLLGPAQSRPAFLKLALAALLPGTLCMGLVTGWFASASSLHLQPGWLQGDQPGMNYWLGNFGLILPLAAVLFLVRNRRDREHPSDLVFGMVGIVVFLVATWVMFAVWPWDNTKIFLWAYLLVVPLIWVRLLVPRAFLVRATICLALFVPGAVTLWNGLPPTKAGLTIVSMSKLASVEHRLRHLPSEARFAAAPTFNHPLSLTGRKVVMGYDGHLYSHGIDYFEGRSALERLMMGDPEWEKLADRLGADFVFWGPLEEQRYRASTKAWADLDRLEAVGTWGRVYRLR